MKKLNAFKYLLGALFLAALLSSCDKFDDDVPPAKMSKLVVNDDHFVTTRNQGIQLNVLANDTIGSNAALQFGQPQHGTLQANNNGVIFYQPTQNYVGNDSFSYTACLDNNCASAMVTIAILPDSSNTCTLVARNDSATVNENQSVTINILGNDNSCSAVPVISRLPLHGQVTINSNNQLVYTPGMSYSGTDNLEYRLSAQGATATANVFITIKPNIPNCPTIAMPDSAFVTRILGTAFDTVSVNVLQNDQFCPNIPVNMRLMNNQSSYGYMTIVGSGTSAKLRYTAVAPVKNVTDTYQYRICQGNTCSTTTVEIYIR